MTSLEHESNETSVSASDYGNENWDNENWGEMDVSFWVRFSLFSLSHSVFVKTRHRRVRIRAVRWAQ